MLKGGFPFLSSDARGRRESAELDCDIDRLQCASTAFERSWNRSMYQYGPAGNDGRSIARVWPLSAQSAGLWEPPCLCYER